MERIEKGREGSKKKEMEKEKEKEREIDRKRYKYQIAFLLKKQKKHPLPPSLPNRKHKGR